MAPKTNSLSLPEKLQEIHELTDSFMFNRAMAAVNTPSGLIGRCWLAERPRRSGKPVAFAPVAMVATTPQYAFDVS